MLVWGVGESAVVVCEAVTGVLVVDSFDAERARTSRPR
jgi:hypothetical protein